PGSARAAMDAPDGDLIDEPPYDPVSDAAAPAPAASGRPTVTVAPHPLQRHALRLAGLLAPEEPAAAGGRRRIGAPGWAAMVGVPVALVAVAQSVLGEIGGILVLLLHVAVLYYTVGLGAFHRRFSELRLLVGAG